MRCKICLRERPRNQLCKTRRSEAAKASIIANADADSIYPAQWLDTIIEPLHNSSISCSYGTYSFIPGEDNNRFTLALYESAANAFFAIKRKQRECVNVMGFNFAYRKADALEVGGFYHQLNRKVTKRSEDGWMAMCLTRKGNLQLVESPHARVWTSDRRLMDDGSIGKALYNRAKRNIQNWNLFHRKRRNKYRRRKSKEILIPDLLK